MATYNGEKYIREQLDSILCQLSESDEVIISDDGSTDSTTEIIKRYNDLRIKLYSNTNRKGVVGNFENALSKVQGDFIFLSDQDDVWMPNKAEVMLKALKNADLCVCDCELIDSDRKILHTSFFKLNHSKRGFLKNLIKNSFLGCCMAFKREVLRYILPFPSNIAMHDIWIGLCVELWGKILFIKDKLVKYRRHGHNTSTTGEKSDFGIIYKVQYRFAFLNQLLRRRFK
jgi:glycosyltransferase involved in cell wall biosynthesis